MCPISVIPVQSQSARTHFLVRSNFFLVFLIGQDLFMSDQIISTQKHMIGQNNVSDQA